MSREFEAAVVMAKYGPQRTYKVEKVRWDMTPTTYRFDQSGGEGSETNMMEYFSRIYQIKLTSP